MNELKQLKILSESIATIERLSEGRYWDNKGAYENEAKELSELVPPSGPSKTLRGEIFRAAQKIYYDYYNNGFGNDWPAPAQFLMNNVKLPPQVVSMLQDHAMGIMGNGIDTEIESMLSTTIEQIYTATDKTNTADMWDTKYDRDDFAEYHEDNEDDDDDWNGFGGDDDDEDGSGRW